MIWTVKWSEKSLKQLKKIDRTIAGRIVDGVDDIQENPFDAVLRLSNSKFYRLRVGDYRVILDLQQGKLIIFVVETDNRGRIYK